MSTKKDALFTPVLIAGGIILLVGFGIRASFGVFQIPIAQEFGWPRGVFSLAIALQNLAWGIGQPFFSMVAERFSDRKAVILGGLFYAVGLLLSSYATTPGAHQGLEILIGFGIAGTGFGVILAVVGRASSDAHRSLSLGIATAFGSGGQVVGPPIAAFLLKIMPWQSVFLCFALAIMLALLMLPFMRSPQAEKQVLEESMGVVLKRAFRDPSYMLIFIGFFSCGYQLAFITAHFPAFITESSAAINPSGLLAWLKIDSPATLGAVAISLIGLSNIPGTIIAGILGKKYAKKKILAWIYGLRVVALTIFLLMPITPSSVVIFSMSIGFLWLATVPLTSGLIAYIYGLRYMGTLYGFVFFSHQMGSFLGVWLGGVLYDLYGNYQIVWWLGAGTGLFSAVTHLLVRERPATVGEAAAKAG